MINSKKVISVLIFIGLIMLAGGCGKKPAVLAEYTNPAVTIEAKSGEQFNIVLISNPTTGYQWQLDGALDEYVIKLDNCDYSPDNPGSLGLGGKEIWTFNALASGQARIRLKYSRQWEKDMPLTRREVFNVIVK